MTDLLSSARSIRKRWSVALLSHFYWKKRSRWIIGFWTDVSFCHPKMNVSRLSIMQENCKLVPTPDLQLKFVLSFFTTAFECSSRRTTVWDERKHFLLAFLLQSTSFCTWIWVVLSPIAEYKLMNSFVCRVATPLTYRACNNDNEVYQSMDCDVLEFTNSEEQKESFEMRVVNGRDEDMFAFWKKYYLWKVQVHAGRMEECAFCAFCPPSLLDQCAAAAKMTLW